MVMHYCIFAYLANLCNSRNLNPLDYEIWATMLQCLYLSHGMNWTSWASCSHLCASVTKQYTLVPAK